MADPRQYPHRLPERQYKLEEFKEIPCGRCGSFYRRVVSLGKPMVHRLDPRVRTETTQNWLFCAGCNSQLDTAGAEVPYDHKDRAPIEAQKEATRA